MSTREFRLDHFLIYGLENQQLVKESVTLEGQFDEREPVKAMLTRLVKFANPVMKDRCDILDKNAHMTGYSLYQRVSEPKRFVKLDNQFGKGQEIIISDAVAMWAPARKYESGIRFPEKLDHYKVYQIVDMKPIQKEVQLKDQFDSRMAKVIIPVAFAVPVEKVHEGKTFSIYNKDTHLTIYAISPSKDIPKIIKARDQFDSYLLRIGRSHRLAVPSRKIEWKVID